MLSDTAVAKQVIASVDEKKQQASEATGIAPEQFKGIHFELDVLRKYYEISWNYCLPPPDHRNTR